MKTFKDLVFKKHAFSSFFDSRAEITFKNGYGVSVINGRGAYCGVDTYEVAVIYEDQLCYTTAITDDVLSDQSPDDIDKVMSKLQNL